MEYQNICTKFAYRQVFRIMQLLTPIPLIIQSLMLISLTFTFHAHGRLFAHPLCRCDLYHYPCKTHVLKSYMSRNLALHSMHMSPYSLT